MGIWNSDTKLQNTKLMRIHFRCDHELCRQSNGNNPLQNSSWNVICNIYTKYIILFDKRNASAQQSPNKKNVHARNLNHKKQTVWLIQTDLAKIIVSAVHVSNYNNTWKQRQTDCYPKIDDSNLKFTL